jgi:hypothetical protein
MVARCLERLNAGEFRAAGIISVSLAFIRVHSRLKNLFGNDRISKFAVQRRGDAEEEEKKNSSFSEQPPDPLQKSAFICVHLRLK